MTATILYEGEAATAGDVREEGGRLWVSAEDLASATGWELKPQGLCKGEACVPLPKDGSWLNSEGRVDLTAFARHMGRPIVHDEEHDVWAFGEAASARRENLMSLEAPDFTLPDLDGSMHSLSDYRGKRIVLHTWGSYCGYKFDQPAWQAVYEELEGEDFELIGVALDAGGKAAVERWIRPTDLDERDETLRKVIGWSESEWSRQAPPEFPCLIDEEHRVAELYGMVNVPNAVWINEEGRIVRPAEMAGHGSDWTRQMDRETFELTTQDAYTRLQETRRVYIDALRDWVERGEDSEFALSPEEVRERISPPNEEDVLAATHARLGRHLFGEEHFEGAKRHFEEAARLVPHKWSYFRQSRVLQPELVGEMDLDAEYWDAVDALGEEDYYPAPADMTGMPDYR